MKRFILSLGLILSMCACQVLDDKLAADGDANSNDTSNEDCQATCEVLTVCGADKSPEEFSEHYHIDNYAFYCETTCTDGKIFDDDKLYEISICATNIYTKLGDEYSPCPEFNACIDRSQMLNGW